MLTRKARIAYDVSLCAKHHNTAGPPLKEATGTARIVESIADRLAASDEFELWMTGCHGGDSRPVDTSAKARIYWEDCWRERHGLSQKVRFLDAVHSRSGRFPDYCRALAQTRSDDSRQASLRQRVWQRGIKTLARLDTQPRSMTGELDLFHSPFLPLPGHQVTGAAPQILTVHDLIPLDDTGETADKKRIYETLKTLRDERSWAICISEWTRRDLCAATGIPPERTVVAPLAAEAIFRPIPNRSSLDELLGERGIPNGPYFLTVSTPQPRKNLPFLIRCFQQIALEPGGEQLRLLLVGSTELKRGRKAIERQIASIPSVKDRILQLGTVSDEELAILYSHCTAFVFPSLREGFGLPPLEAMQCGAPVICANTTSLPEVTGNAALLISPKDERTLVEAMREVASNASRRAELSALSIRRAAQFSWDQTAAIVMDTYRKALR